MRKTQLFTAVIFILILFLLRAHPARASEGTVEMVSTTGQASRCFAASVLMRDFNYSLVVSCRDLIYPPATDLFTYLLWATSAKDGKPIKIGELGIGKAEFKTSTSFTELFITKERDGRPSSPSEPVVIWGAVKPIGFLEGPPPPTAPAAEVQPIAPTPVSATPSGGLAAGIRRAVLIFLLALFSLIILVVAVISTFRRLRG